ncbi:MAG: SDR family NAD(P)-dependent oxidoreductase [Clostridia bacterium]|nr:SDR family NAD(P)-dependent oxidoreductase [Clostridia bacterium]
MDLIKNYLYRQVANHSLSQPEAKQMLLELKEKTHVQEDEIAIIGMAGRFPKAKNIEEYWENIKNGVIGIGELPQGRVKDIEDFLLRFHYRQLADENAIKEDGHLNVTYETRGYLDEIDKFDAAFFGIPPREAKTMDPDQRMFLEIAYEAIEDAGYSGSKMYGTNTGVFAGIDHVSDLKYKQLAADDPMVVTGTWPGILASRVSYIYNFHGPSIVIDTACSSGLVSVHMACNSLKNGECEMAIAGGLSSFYYRPLKFKDELKELDSVESKDNIVRTFDKNANGTVWGEGVGAVFLKPLSKALADGDVIHAVIKASAINNDGASNGITAPDAGAQENLLLDVWKKAKINPETVQYIEAHGTGTVLGDPIEIKAMTNAFRSVTDKKQFCGVGAVKTSIGHLVGASGLASLLKVVMMLKNKSIPASLNFAEPNPFINFCDSPVYISDKLREWEREGAPRRAGINSFGFSGTNCHVVLEEAPQLQVKEDMSKSEFEMFTISAKSQSALKEIVKRYQKEFSGIDLNLQDVCYTANTGRGHYTHRFILIVKDYNDLKEKIKYISKTDFNEINKSGVYYGEHKIVPDNKTVREKGEIVEAERRKLCRSSETKLEDLMQNYSYPTAAELCDLYIKGAKVEWDKLYIGQNRRRLNLPVYPLERTRYWYDEKKADKKVLKMERKGDSKEYEHPLLDRRLADSIYQGTFATDFSVDRHWILADHIIMNNHVIPGTGCIEMAMEACKKYYGDSPVEFKDIIFFSPCIVDKNEVKEVQTIIIKEQDYLEFTIASRAATNDFDERWIKHAEGKIYRGEAVASAYNIDEIYNRLKSEQGRLELAEPNPENGPVKLGAHWKNHTIIAVGKNELLVDMELPDKVADDLHLYTLHPAMLDNAVNAVCQRVGSGLYLPFYYKSFKLSGRIPIKFYSYIKIKNDVEANPETVDFDIVLTDREGQAFAVIEDYKIKKVNEAEFKFKELSGKSNTYFELGWVNKELKHSDKDLVEGDILVFRDSNGMGEQLIRSLKESGSKIIEVETASEFKKLGEDKYTINGEASDYRALFDELKGKEIKKILHLQGITGNDEIKDLSQLEKAQSSGVYSLFYLVRTLVDNKYKDLEIVVAADYANEVTKDEKTINPHNAALFGLAKIVPMEYSSLKCRCIDIDGDTKVDSIISEIASKELLPKVAYRNGKRYVEELRKIDLEIKKGGSVGIKEHGVYVITGGNGGLGLELGKYLASKNKVNIALINRSKLPERSKWNEILAKAEERKTCRAIKSIIEIEETGAQVTCLSANVSNMNEMKEAIDTLRSRYGAINGIIHCAGVAGDGFIMRKEKQVFDSVIAPKVQGTWILNKLTEEDNMDFFVMFSSILAVFGDQGQGDYAAANSYLDAFAVYRSKQGKRTATINWPAWKETGMAVDYNIDGSDSIVKPITTVKALNCFEEVLSSGISKVLPGELNYDKLLNIKEGLTFSLSDKIITALQKHKIKINANKKTEVEEENTVSAVIKGRGDIEYNETESKLAQIWSQVLGLNEIDIFDNFSSMGGDSMLAIQLLKQIDKVYPGIIDISDVFTYPSIQQMASYIDEKMGLNKEENKVSKKEENLSDEVLKNMVEGLESGETSIENALKILGIES